jgi:hypothetical protein
MCPDKWHVQDLWNIIDLIIIMGIWVKAVEEFGLHWRGLTLFAVCVRVQSAADSPVAGML